MIVGRFLYEEGSPANVFYRNCLVEMRSKFHIEKEQGSEADVEGDEGLYMYLDEITATEPFGYIELLQIQ